MLKLQNLISALGMDVDDEPEKLVVASEFPVVCLVVLYVSLHFLIALLGWI